MSYVEENGEGAGVTLEKVSQSPGSARVDFDEGADGMTRLFYIAGTVGLILLGLSLYSAAFKHKNLDGEGVIFTQ